MMCIANFSDRFRRVYPGKGSIWIAREPLVGRSRTFAPRGTTFPVVPATAVREAPVPKKIDLLR